MKILVLLAVLVTCFEAPARTNRRAREKYTKMMDLLKRIEIARRNGGSRPRMQARTRDYLTRRASKMGVTLSQLQKSVSRHSNKESSISGLKKLLLLSSSSNKDVAERKSAEKLLSYVIKLDKAETGFHLKPDVIAEALTSWSPKEVKELSSLLKQAVETVESGSSSNANRVFMELLGTTNSSKYKNACK